MTAGHEVARAGLLQEPDGLGRIRSDAITSHREIAQTPARGKIAPIARLGEKSGGLAYITRHRHALEMHHRQMAAAFRPTTLASAIVETGRFPKIDRNASAALILLTQEAASFRIVEIACEAQRLDDAGTIRRDALHAAVQRRQIEAGGGDLEGASLFEEVRRFLGFLETPLPSR